jgi:hypothetical protein
VTLGLARATPLRETSAGAALRSALLMLACARFAASLLPWLKVQIYCVGREGITRVRTANVYDRHDAWDVIRDDARSPTKYRVGGERFET